MLLPHSPEGFARFEAHRQRMGVTLAECFQFGSGLPTAPAAARSGDLRRTTEPYTQVLVQVGYIRHNGFVLHYERWIATHVPVGDR